MSRGLGVSQGSGLPFWAAAEIDGNTGTFRVGSQHPGFAACARQAGVPAGGYDLTLSDPLANGTAIALVGIITEDLTGQTYSVRRISDSVWRVRTIAGGDVDNADFYIAILPTSPIG